MSSLKIALAQIHQLADTHINKSINGIIYPLRRAMLLEARKDEPNLDIIRTCRDLERSVVDNYDNHKVHTLESTALFVFRADEKSYKTAEEKELAQRNSAREALMRRIADKQVRAPKSKAELDQMISLEIQRTEDEVAENFGVAIDAVQLIETMCAEDGQYDEDVLPEWVSESVVGKIVDAGTQAFRDSKMRMQRAKFEFQKLEPRAGLEGAKKLLAFFGVTEDEVEGYLESSVLEARNLISRLERDVPNIEDTEQMETPKEKKNRYRVTKEKAAGLSSEDMAAANGVK